MSISRCHVKAERIQRLTSFCNQPGLLQCAEQAQVNHVCLQTRPCQRTPHGPWVARWCHLSSAAAGCTVSETCPKAIPCRIFNGRSSCAKSIPEMFQTVPNIDQNDSESVQKVVQHYSEPVPELSQHVCIMWCFRHCSVVSTGALACCPLVD